MDLQKRKEKERLYTERLKQFSGDICMAEEKAKILPPLQKFTLDFGRFLRLSKKALADTTAEELETRK